MSVINQKRNISLFFFNLNYNYRLAALSYLNEDNFHILKYFLVAGDLKTYLLSRRNLVGSDCKEAFDISSERLTQMALDVASGLKYMHDLKYVHR